MVQKRAQERNFVKVVMKKAGSINDGNLLLT